MLLIIRCKRRYHRRSDGELIEYTDFPEHITVESGKAPRTVSTIARYDTFGRGFLHAVSTSARRAAVLS
jgi:hypothetical protein